jgi:cytochrome c553
MWAFGLVMALAPCATWLAASPVHAQTALQPPPAAQPAPAAMARRMKACTPCHGPSGVAQGEAYHPRIAGKPAGYLLQQLQHFRDGRRQNATMAHLVAQMDDAYLGAIAGYFAALDLPYPPPLTPAAVRLAVPGADLARGEQLARHGDAALALPACAACHGPTLAGLPPAMPGLLGLPPAYVMAQVGAWHSGLRRARAPDCMQQIAQRLSRADLGAVAAWLALQPVPAAPLPEPSGPQPPLPLACGSVQP